ncbi:hypothetical protein [Henriciella aquimarina]|uniref:hypothetical protein n=1 Tax=Henriciella aquimarina TaxID=545261 RepID=UPI0009FE4652|nr:hypothetical protein [Henriciella aquimarina]
MSFHEKSAWVMGAVLLIAAAWYFRTVAAASAALGEVAPPLLPLVVGYIVLIIVLSIIAHILVAVTKPSEADDTLDERDRIIASRAGSFGGVLLGVGVLTGLGGYLFDYDGNKLFHIAFGAMMVAQLGEYAAKIWYYRRGVV